MSYQWEPIFICGLCGKARSSQRWEDMPFGWKMLPEGWTGSSRKHGECYCEDCTQAIERTKEEMSE